MKPWEDVLQLQEPFSVFYRTNQRSLELCLTLVTTMISETHALSGHMLDDFTVMFSHATCLVPEAR
jgi:hypothetical protein